MRLLGRFLVFLLVLGVILVVADVAIAQIAERRAAEQVSETLDAPAEVDIRGFPAGLQLLTGRVRQVDIAATDVPLEQGPTLDRLDVSLTDVRLDWRDLRGERDSLPPADQGTFEAELGQESVRELLGGVSELADVTLTDGVLRLDIAGFVVDADISAEDGMVVITPQSPVTDLLTMGAGFSVDLSGQPGQPRVEEAEVREDAIVVRGTLEEVTGS